MGQKKKKKRIKKLEKEMEKSGTANIMTLVREHIMGGRSRTVR